jgi:uncharacterized protein YjbJ (UPF0337 family)
LISFPILKTFKHDFNTAKCTVETSATYWRKFKVSTEDRAKATAKNVEGKAQEALGEVTGDSKDKAAGKAKQAESETRHAVEDVKDNIKRAID